MENWTRKEYWQSRFDEGDTPWDLGEASPTIIALIDHLKPSKGSHFFVPGCGLGHDALYLAEKDYQVTVCDWYQPALNQIKEAAEKKSVPLEIHDGDFFQLPNRFNGKFDFIVEHTFLCSIDPSQRARYAKVLSQLLKENGEVLGSLFIHETATSINDRTQAGPPFFMPEGKMREIFSPLFKILCLEPSPSAPESRKDFEWWAHFRMI